jgi:hypothetical protein
MPDGQKEEGSAPMLYVTKVDLQQKEQPPLQNLMYVCLSVSHAQ